MIPHKIFSMLYDILKPYLRLFCVVLGFFLSAYMGKKMSLFEIAVWLNVFNVCCYYAAMLYGIDSYIRLYICQREVRPGTYLVVLMQIGIMGAMGTLEIFWILYAYTNGPEPIINMGWAVLEISFALFGVLVLQEIRSIISCQPKTQQVPQEKNHD